MKQKAKEKNYFREIRAKKVHSKMDQQQNGQCQKGPQQNGPRQSGRAIKSCTLFKLLYLFKINFIKFSLTILKDNTEKNNQE